MKLLLIGRKGQVASEIRTQSEKEGIKCFALSREEIDILDRSSIEKNINKIKPDILINTSGRHLSVNDESNPENLFDINTVGVAKLAQASNSAGIPFLTFSSNYVFDGFKMSPYEENDKPRPIQLYGISKLAGEIAALNACKNTYIIRTGGVYGGSKGSPDKGNFVLRIIKEAKTSSTIYVSSEQKTSTTYAKDLSYATMMLLKKKSNPGIYHLVNEGVVTWNEFAKRIVSLARIKVRVVGVDKENYSDGVRRPLNSALKNTKAKKLSIKLPSWEDGIAEYISFLKDG